MAESPGSQGLEFEEGGLFKQPADGIFEDYQVRARYEHDRHIYMSGVTSPGGFQGKSVAFYQLAAPTLLLVVEWTAMKTHVTPEYPNQNLAGPGWILLTAIPEVPNITVFAESTITSKRLSGVYIYGRENPSDDVFKDMSYPLPPYLEASINRQITPGKKTQGIIQA